MTASGPLAGTSVVVTRSRAQAPDLVERLEAAGAEVVAVPVIEIVDPSDPALLADAIRRLDTYDWVVLSSANAVERFFSKLGSTDRIADALAHVKLAAVGKATAERMRGYGAEPDLVPREFRAEGLVEAFREAGAGPGWRVLVPRAEQGREVLREGLEALGCEVDVVPAYRTAPAEPGPGAIERLRAGVDAVTFTSPSTVRNFVAVLASAGMDTDAFMGSVLKACIGPVTSEALEGIGHAADVEASEHTVPALVEALSARIERGGAPA